MEEMYALKPVRMGEKGQAAFPSLPVLPFRLSFLSLYCLSFLFICLKRKERGLEWTKTSARTYWSSG